jgi:hypothetical protein
MDNTTDNNNSTAAAAAPAPASTKPKKDKVPKPKKKEESTDDAMVVVDVVVEQSDEKAAAGATGESKKAKNKAQLTAVALHKLIKDGIRHRRSSKKAPATDKLVSDALALSKKQNHNVELNIMLSDLNIDLDAHLRRNRKSNPLGGPARIKNMLHAHAKEYASVKKLSVARNAAGVLSSFVSYVLEDVVAPSLLEHFNECKIGAQQFSKLNNSLVKVTVKENARLTVTPSIVDHAVSNNPVLTSLFVGSVDAKHIIVDEDKGLE